VHKIRAIAITALLSLCLGGVLSTTTTVQTLADSPWGTQKHHVIAAVQAHVSVGTDATPGSSDDSPWGFH